jgi:hypothetical protein
MSGLNHLSKFEMEIRVSAYEERGASASAVAERVLVFEAVAVCFLEARD